MTNNLKDLYLPPKDSHKGQNGKLLIIGGSHLFHAASLWSLKVASRLVDLVHYASVIENNKIVQKFKEEFRDGIAIARVEIENYIDEDDCILIGPGMVRTEGPEIRNSKFLPCRQAGEIRNLADIEKIEDEGVQTYYLTKYLLRKYPKKKWVIDAGALQMMDLEDIPPYAILTPHHKEFDGLELRIKNKEFGMKMKSLKLKERVILFAKKYHCTVLMKGEIDYLASEDKAEEIRGGNAGMTKGGTGDVLAGLTAGLYTKNEAYLSAWAAAYIHKRSGEDLFEKMGYWYNASDLVDQIPQTMKRLILI